MDNFGKRIKSFTSNKVVSKIVFTWIVISTRQLSYLFKQLNQVKQINCVFVCGWGGGWGWGVCKFYSISQSSNG